MLKNIKAYEKFLEKQLVERQNFLKEVTTKMVDDLTEYLKGWGWERKGNGGGLSYGDKIKGIKYAKTFNGKEVVIQYRNNLRVGIHGRLHFEKGINEFVHDSSFSKSIRRVRPKVGYFNWNGQKDSGWDLDFVIENIEKFYSKNVK